MHGQEHATLWPRATGSALASHDHVSWHADIGRHSSLEVASGGHEMNRYTD